VAQIKNIAIIPARGGSKRLPGKNFKAFGKHPLLAHSILYALRFPEIIDTVVVSTDDADLATIAKSYGAEISMRPSILAGDHEPVITALQHSLQNQVESFDNIFLLQPTNPLRPSDLLSSAYKSYLEHNVESLITVSLLKEKFGEIVGNSFQPGNYAMGQRSQDLKPLYKENGLLYITKSQAILKGEILTSNNYAFVTNSPFDNVDIDTESDFMIAETLLKKYFEEL
jgi:N-acylneuraminate cytidylyltransferase